MAIQFIILMILLNSAFYKPITKIIDEREEYIRNSLTTASANLIKANALTNKYEEELSEARQIAQIIISQSKKEAQSIVSANIQNAQKDAEKMVKEALQQLNLQKEQALKTLESQVDILSEQIKNKLLSGQTL